jgi:hypothetical protein
MPIRRIDQRMATLDDCEVPSRPAARGGRRPCRWLAVLQAFHADDARWDGLVTADAKMLGLPRARGALSDASHPRGGRGRRARSDQDHRSHPRSHQPDLEQTRADTAQALRLRTSTKPDEKRWDFLPSRRTLDSLAEDLYASERLTKDQLRRSPLESTDARAFVAERRAGGTFDRLANRIRTVPHISGPPGAEDRLISIRRHRTISESRELVRRRKTAFWTTHSTTAPQRVTLRGDRDIRPAVFGGQWIGRHRRSERSRGATLAPPVTFKIKTGGVADWLLRQDPSGPPLPVGSTQTTSVPPNPPRQRAGSEGPRN